MNTKNILGALVITIASFGLLGIPYTDWWFNGDDFGSLHYAAKTKNISDIVEGNPNKYFHSSNVHPKPQITFFNVYYRPLFCGTVMLLHKIFNAHGYAYYLFNVLIHTINALLLFYVLLYFTATLPALLFTFFFLFHPQIGFRFGHMANIQYYLNVTLFFVIALLIKHYFDKHRSISLWTSYVLFFMSLFMRETGIVLTLLLPIGSYLYLHRNNPASCKQFLRFIKSYFFHFLAFFLITIFYLICRGYFHPFTFSHMNEGSALIGDNIKNLFGRWYEVITFLYDFYGLSWLPYGYKTGKYLLFGLLSLSLFTLFVRSKQKLLLLFLYLSIGLLLWPSIPVHYSARYVYEISPLITLLFACSISFSSITSRLLKKVSLACSLCFIGLLMFLTTQNLRCREKKLASLKKAVLTFTSNPAIHGRALCMLTYPVDGFGSGMTTAMQYFTKQYDIPVLTDLATRLVQRDSNVFHSDWWHLKCSNYIAKDYVKVVPVENGFRFTSMNTEKTCFFFQEELSNTSLGKKTIHKKSEANITDFTLTLDNQWLKLKPFFVIWDYEKQGFEILKS